MKFVLGFLVFAVLAQLHNLADARNDDTRRPGASGEAVVRATINQIRQALPLKFPDDKDLLRRIALVETNYGNDSDTYRENYHGGIWQVDEDMFNQTQTIVMPSTRPAVNIIKIFQIDWHAITWEDLKKPLYSGLAARLFLNHSGIAEEIPLASDVEGQAKYWKTYYDLQSGPRTEEEFVEAVNREPDLCAVSGIDMVFLLDASGSIGYANFGLIKHFVANVTNGLDIGSDDVQIAVIKYEDEVNPEFHLNQYHNKSAVLQAISSIIYTGGGTETHLGLQAVLAEFNNSARHVDEGIPRIAFVLTDGQSNDFQATVDAARQLHDANIEVYAVAIGAGPNHGELSAIATSAAHVLTTNFVVVELKKLQERLDRETCEANVFALVGQQFESTLEDGEVAYFAYDLPNDGLTLCIEVIEGYVVIYVSTKVSNPNEALNDLEVEATSKVCFYVPPETSSNERRRRQSPDTDSLANETTKVYISIEGHSSLNRFVLNTTYDDTTERPLKITFERDSPVVSGNDTIAFIRTNKPVIDMECRMSGTKEVKNCTSGYVEFNDLPERNKYTLKVVAETEEGETATIRREFRIERPEFCSAHLINEGVSIQGRKVTVQFSPSGGTQNTECILNPPKTIENPFFSCTSPVIMYLPPGPHKLKITPWGCGRNRKPLVVTFEV